MNSLPLPIKRSRDFLNDIAIWYIIEEQKRKKHITRSPNLHRPRQNVLDKIMKLNDMWFTRNYRLSRQRFFLIIDSLSMLPTANDYGVMSSGSIVHPIIRLAITLRFLAGGSYLDICFGYEISVSAFYAIVFTVMQFIRNTMNNIVFPIGDIAKLAQLESEFSSICNGTFRGTVAAGDGVVFKMKKPTKAEVNGNVASFFSRKGYYAYGLQAFCSATTKFLSISMKTCGSTHDSTSYIISSIGKSIKDGQLHKDYHIVLDEAYKCTDQELSPWKGRNLSPDKDAFNYYLSLHRQCIERAFGILVNRFGIFWRPLKVKVRKYLFIFKICH
jgi:hypothetical protein